MSTNLQRTDKAVAYRTTVDGNPALFVTGYIWDGFGLMLADVVQQMFKDTGKRVTIYLDSNGGLLAQAFAFYDFVRSKSIPIAVEGFGTVGSAATVVAMAAGRDNIKLAANTDWFIHRVSFRDQYGDVVQGDDAERDRLNAKLVVAYMAHTGMDEAAVNALLDDGDNSVSINADRAVELGFAAGILAESESATKAAALKSVIPTNNAPAPMSTKKVAVKLSLLQAVNSLTSEGTTVEVDMEAKAAETIDQLTAERDAKATEVTNLTTRIAELEAAKADAEAKATQAEAAKAEADTKVSEAETAKTEAVNAKALEVTNLTGRVRELEEQLNLPAAKRTVPRAENAIVGGLPNGGGKSASDLAAEAFRKGFTTSEVAVAEANKPKA